MSYIHSFPEKIITDEDYTSPGIDRFFVFSLTLDQLRCDSNDDLSGHIVEI